MIGDLSNDDQRSGPRENALELHREWPGLPRAGAGQIVTIDIPLERPDDPRISADDIRRRIDESWESGFKCGTEVHRCELRAAREVRDAIAATRAFRLQMALLVAICVVVLAATVLLVH